MTERDFYVYIMANKRNGALFVGATLDLVKRVYPRTENWVLINWFIVNITMPPN